MKSSEKIGVTESDKPSRGHRKKNQMGEFDKWIQIPKTERKKIHNFLISRGVWKKEILSSERYRFGVKREGINSWNYSQESVVELALKVNWRGKKTSFQVRRAIENRDERKTKLSFFLHHSEFVRMVEHGVDGGALKTICVHSFFHVKSVDFSLLLTKWLANISFSFSYFFNKWWDPFSFLFLTAKLTNIRKSSTSTSFAFIFSF